MRHWFVLLFSESIIPVGCFNIFQYRYIVIQIQNYDTHYKESIRLL